MAKTTTIRAERIHSTRIFSHQIPKQCCSFRVAAAATTTAATATFGDIQRRTTLLILSIKPRALFDGIFDDGYRASRRRVVQDGLTIRVERVHIDAVFHK